MIVDRTPIEPPGPSDAFSPPTSIDPEIREAALAGPSRTRDLQPVVVAPGAAIARRRARFVRVGLVAGAVLAIAGVTAIVFTLV
ncbi:MAG: hypothetical protein JHC95_10200 [Solirubrobacteraceae bacterium]|nr:hypothetical protein [Solirubrobacteraceae bacterium]